MDSTSTTKHNKILCRLCAKENDKYFEIFGEQGVTWKIASIVSSHFWFEVKKNKQQNVICNVNRKYFVFQLKESDEFPHICHTCWWKIETFHVYYLEIEKAQKFFDLIKVEYGEQNTDESLLSTNNIEEEACDITDEKYDFDCDKPPDTLSEC